MGLWDDVKQTFSNPVTWVMPAAAPFVYSKNKRNQELDKQMVSPGSPPGLLDPNDVGVPEQGGSAWARMQRGQNAMDAGRAMQGSRGSAYGALASARSDLASRGGLSSGASERLAMAGMGNDAMMRQNNAADLARANMGTNIEDERMRRNAYNQIRMQNQGMQGALYAGNNMANATVNAARPQGMLGLGFLGL